MPAFGGYMTLRRKIAGVQLIIFSFGRDQFVMGAALDDAPLLHDHDAVRVLDRGQPVGNDECSPALHQCVHAGLHQFLGAGIDGRRGFIQDQRRRVRHCRARAMARSCLWPWLKLAPSPVSMVSYPSGRRRMNPSALASFAALMHSSSVASSLP